jgi:hypothetical protein
MEIYLYNFHRKELLVKINKTYGRKVYKITIEKYIVRIKKTYGKNR